MAQCKRCGAVFDYEKREGVCPKCCFYNRPPGTWQDDEWTTTYNIEDNSYELPKKIIQDGQEFEKRILGKSQNKKREDRKRKIQTGRRYETPRKKQGGKEQASLEKKTPIFKVIVLLLVVVLFAITIYSFFLGDNHFEFTKDEGQQGEKLQGEELQVEVLTKEEAEEGLDAGDVVYYVSDVTVLFQEGELPSMPEGEKCIGIWLESTETDDFYDGSRWYSPYVFDGTNFRELLDTEVLDESAEFEELETFSPYFTGGQAGYGVFFVDADASSVTLTIPYQIVEDEDTVTLSKVMDIDLPIE